MKAALLGIAALDRIRWRQRSRVLWLKFGNANTRFFHLKANGRRRKNFIPSLKNKRGVEVHDHGAKADILHSHFRNLLGEVQNRSVGLNWELLHNDQADLSHLDEGFTIEELKAAVFDMHAEKAPGPDGFVGGFFKSCWSIISHDRSFS